MVLGFESHYSLDRSLMPIQEMDLSTHIEKNDSIIVC